ncbi:unnamed protein product, partial [Ectocarpus sp. 4 AP-2014]
MFHAVHQIPGEDLGSPGAGALPMFREQRSSSHGLGGSSDGARGRSGVATATGSGRRTHRVGGDGSGILSASVEAAGGVGGSSDLNEPPRVLEMRPLHHGGTAAAAARRRRSGYSKESGRSTPGRSKSSHHRPGAAAAFAGPDGMDAGFADPAGTFRWDATVADAAT